MAAGRQAALIAALLAGLAVPAAARAPRPSATPAAVVLRTGNHRGYGRVVFAFPGAVAYRIRQVGDRVILRFSNPAAIPSAAGPRNVRAIRGGPGRAEITIAPRSTIRWMQFGPRVVVDVLDPAPPHRAARARAYPVALAMALPLPPSPPARVPPAEAAPLAHPLSWSPAGGLDPSAAALVAQTAARLAPLAGGTPAPGAPVPLLPAPAAAPAAAAAAAPSSALGPAVPLSSTPAAMGAPGLSIGAVPVVLPKGAMGAAIRLPFAAGVGAAAFARGAIGLIVFDRPRPIDMAEVREVPILGAGTVRVLPDATLFRVILPPGFELRLARDTAGWTVAAVPSPPPVPPLAPEAIRDTLWLPLRHHGRVVIVADPETGAPLLVGTARIAGVGLAVVRRYPQFSLEPSWLGVVVAPLSDRLVLKARHGGFLLRASGTTLALPAQPGNAAALADAATLSRRFDFPDLPLRQLRGRLLSELDGAATAPPLSRTAARLAEVQTMVALGMGVEARGVLRLAAAEDPAAATRPLWKGLWGIASWLAGDPAGTRRLGASGLDGSDEITLWRAVAEATRHPGSPVAAAGFAATMPLILAYPATLRDRLLPLAAETMIAGGQMGPAASLLAGARGAKSLRLARAMMAARQGKTDQALAAYRRLARSRDRLTSARAAVRAVKLRLATGAISPSAAAADLDRLLYAWRGPRRELALRLEVAKLRIASGAYRPALALLRRTEHLFPAQAPLIHARLAAAFAGLLAPKVLGRIPPLQLVALVQENADLVPHGHAGEVLAAGLAQRLVALDLPARAIPVLTRLMKKAPPGVVRARFGERLAAMDLEQEDAAGALAALAASAAPGLSAGLAARRTLIFARAAARQGRLAPAVAALTGLGTPAADDLRARLLARAGDWRGAEAALASLAAKAVPASGALNPAAANILLRLATAATHAGDQATLAQLGTADGARIGNGPIGKMFHLLTGGPVSAISDLPRATRTIAFARAVPAALHAIAGR